MSSNELLRYFLVETCAVLHSSTQFRQFTAHSGSGVSVMRVEINLPSVSLVLLLSLEIVDKDLDVLLRVVVAGDDDGVEWKCGT